MADFERHEVIQVIEGGRKCAGADLRDIDLNRADLRGAHLGRADLRRAHLNRADLSRANLNGANLNGAMYHADTRWPEGVDPVAAGALLVDWPDGVRGYVEPDR